MKRIDWTGFTCGDFGVFEYLGDTYWRCICVNQHIMNIMAGRLNPEIRCSQCETRHKNLHDLTGQTFNYWTVESRYVAERKRKPHWNCVCMCGNKGVVNASNLKSGKSFSCGCAKLLNQRLKAKREKLERGEYLGVSNEQGGFVARFMHENKFVNGETIHKTAIDAAHDYDRMAFEEYGEFAVLNFPSDYD